MGGGLMQLVAYGAQDIYLTGNPQITFFKVVYRRHTNFSIETIAQAFSASVDFGRKTSVIIPRNGDLISKMYLLLKLPALKQAQSTDATNSTWVNYTNGLGNAIIKSVSIDIGGQEIDKHYGEWMDIWNELYLSDEQKKNYNKMVFNKAGEPWTNPEHLTSTSGSDLVLHVPLLFWFNRNPGLALPLIALQYHEVKVNLELEDAKYLVRSDKGNITSPVDTSSNALAVKNGELLVDYIYLDTDERRRFAQVSHEYLIEQVQYTGAESLDSGTTNVNLDLNYNHPCKVIHWIIQDDTFTTGGNSKSFKATTTAGQASGGTSGDSNVYDGGNQKLRYSSLARIGDSFNTFSTAKLQLNGHDRFGERDADYFRLVQPSQHLPGATNKYIYTYSFSLKPAEHQPSGTCNFSRIDSAKLNLNFDTTTSSVNKKDGYFAAGTAPLLGTYTDGIAYTGHLFNDSKIKMFAVNYNVLRIMSGMGGLAYSN
jgi:hypothetical protein